MKTKVLLGTTVVLAATFVFLFPDTQQKQIVKQQNASFYSIKCTAAKFLLKGVDTTRQISPLFENLGNLSFSISVKDPVAQQFFDQGLRLIFAFNHAEAHRSFMEVARLEPGSAMAYWGQAFALGPNINDPFPDDERKKKCLETLERANQLAGAAGMKEQSLIRALNSRYHNDFSVDIAKLNQDFMRAMAETAAKFPDDPTVLTLYADAIMNTMPWNYWDNEGLPAENTLAAKAALEKAISLDAGHPGAHHAFIHLMELPQPEAAVPSADTLGSLMPAAGHIVHMPAHIYIRVGRYQDAVKVNELAILADEDYISQCYSQGMYPLAYYPHNLHFLWSAASLLGDSEKAIGAAQKTAEKVPVGELVALPFLQDFASTPILAYTRFGKWNDILTIPYPGDQYKHLNLIWHYARGIAFIRKGNFPQAAEEYNALALLSKDPELENIVANYTNPSSKIALVAEKVLAGELAAAKGDLNSAIMQLKEAVVYEDALTYSEPAAWHIPVRQTLGAVLYRAGNYKEAEKIYREDLQVLRQNGWSLMGLYNSLSAQGKNQDAQKIKEEYDTAWQDADIKISTSVL